MSGSREREAWTKFVEQHEREKQRKRPRAKKQSGPTPEEMEAALDDLVGENKSDKGRGSKP
jgi:hypothetical protein